MKFQIALLAALVFSGCKFSSRIQGEKSDLSTVMVAKFQQKADAKAWSSMQIRVSNAVSGDVAVDKKANLAEFSAGSNSVELKLKYGSYRFVLEYFDADGKTLLYRSCQDADKQDAPVPVNEPKVNLKIDMCVMAAAAGSLGDKAGAIGEAEVSILPVLQDDPAAGSSAAAGPVADNFLFVDAAGSINCTNLSQAKFGDPAARKSHLCAIHTKLIPGAGFYLKGSIKVAATGKSVRVTMSGFGMKDAAGALTSKNWSARDGATLTVNETVQVELGKDACLAGQTLGAQVGTVLIYTDAAGDLTFNEFLPINFAKVSCK